MIPQDVIDYIRDTRSVVRRYQEVQEGSVFILASWNISNEDSFRFIAEAKALGARYIIINENLPIKTSYSDNIIKVANPSLCWAFVSSILYEEIPAKICAVTGTSGKTTVAYIFSQIAAILSGKALYVGTLGALKISSDLSIEFLTASLTTPDSMDLRRILSDSRDCDYVCIEASSHGIEQNRIAYLPIAAAGFTNLSSEHLDYHENIKSYFESKKRLFTEYKIQDFVINLDDDYGAEIYRCNGNIIGYGRSEKAKLKFISFFPGKIAKISYEGKEFEFKYHFLGEYNLYNFLCAAGLLIKNGFKLEEVLEVVHKIALPPGRMEKIERNGLEVYVDYAHKPNALESALKALVDYRDSNKKGKLWVVFGCGGNRDKIKRPMMGKIVSDLADVIIVTDDNPRYEDAVAIRREISNGIMKPYLEIGDRKEAIIYAIEKAGKNDIILVSGKGHENYQVVGDIRISFSDVSIVKEEFEKKTKLRHIK